jgi:hypothetical protein
MIDPTGATFLPANTGVLMALGATSGGSAGRQFASYQPDYCVPGTCWLWHALDSLWTNLVVPLYQDAVKGVDAFVSALDSTLNVLAPWCKECGIGALKGAVLAKWSLTTIAVGAGSGCLIDLTAAGLRKLGYKRAAEVVEYVNLTNEFKEFGEGFIRRFGGREVEEIVQVEVRRASGGRLLVRVVYVASH